MTGYCPVRMDAGGGRTDGHLRHATLPRRNAQLRPGHLRLRSLRSGTSSLTHSRLVRVRTQSIITQKKKKIIIKKILV